jgi:hypothetical protein
MVWIISMLAAFYGGLILGALLANSKARENAEREAFLSTLRQVTR